MKLRRIELKEVPMMEERPNGRREQIGVFSYRSILREILMTSPPAQPDRGFAGGLRTDEIATSIMVYGRISEAAEKAADHVLLDRESYEYLMLRLNTFRWNGASEAALGFIQHVKGAKEEDFDVVPKPAPQPAPAALPTLAPTSAATN
jgi:hypothetical protein